MNEMLWNFYKYIFFEKIFQPTMELVTTFFFEQLSSYKGKTPKVDRHVQGIIKGRILLYPV